MDKKQLIQSQEYSFPYHYIPSINSKGDYLLTRVWGYAKSWLAASQIINSYIKSYCSKGGLHIDLGCGDGALINFLNTQNNYNFRFLGIDYDKKGIEWAKIFNTSRNVIFKSQDILQDERKLKYKADTLSLVEVIEHIPPKKLNKFLERSSLLLKENGFLMLTVPHENKVLEKKHFQHFSFRSLENKLARYYRVKEIWGFESMPLYLKIIRKLLESDSHNFEIKFLSKIFVRQLAKKVEEKKSRKNFLFGSKD